ncbi:hypothetical protein L1987_21730 [Smallanthus sonchifolius]|uniref:Uncharacterized protein n=1 Tax=Smallanthus sonchifolius TaxID=185202 RepID=A0ACB9IDV2_9ASTR|nr:hypothetical protein L1987_21730 [Smallanthus sonchifolius]
MKYTFLLSTCGVDVYTALAEDDGALYGPLHGGANEAGILKPDTVEGSETETHDSYMHPQYFSDVMKPLQIEQLMDQEVVDLSGAELQRVALSFCLCKIVNSLFSIYNPCKL